MPAPLGSSLDPALLAVPVQPSHLEPSAPMDPLQQALDALLATGALPAGQTAPMQPGMGPGTMGTGPMDTALEQPGGPTMGRHDPAIMPTSEFRPQLNHIPDAWHQAAGPGGIVNDVAHLAPATVQNHQVRPSREIYPAPPPRVDPVTGAMQAEEAAIQQAGAARQQQAVAEHQSAVSLADRMAVADDTYVNELGTLNASHQRARQAVHAQADAESNAWLEQYMQAAQKEPNPGRWWDNQSGLGKALWGLGMVFSAAHVALTPGAQNVALNMVMDNINKDVAEQKARLDREIGALKLKGQVMTDRQRRNLTDLTDDHTMALGRLAAVHQALRTRAATPGNEQLAAGLAAADTWFQDQYARLKGERVTQQIMRSENQLQRGHAMAVAKMTDKRERDITAANIAARYDLARLEAGAALAKQKGDAMKDVEGVSPDLGAVMTGSQLGSTVQVHKDNAVKMREVFSVANRRYDNLVMVSAALKDGSFTERMVTGDPELMSAARELGYTTAKEMDPSGKLSDSDVKFATAIDLGFDPGGTAWDKVRFANNVPEIQKMVERELRSLPDAVSNNAGMYLNPNLVGDTARVVWTPKSMTRPELTPPNATEAMGGISVSPPKDSADFKARVAKEASDPMYRGRELPAYDRHAVENLAQATAGLGPTQIRQMAEKALKDYADPWGAPRGDATTTRIAIETVRDEAVAAAEKAVKHLSEAARNRGYVSGVTGRGAPTRAEVLDMAKTADLPLTDAPDEIDRALKVAEEAYREARRHKGLK
jgi:hypothetical protein